MGKRMKIEPKVLRSKSFIHRREIGCSKNIRVEDLIRGFQDYGNMDVVVVFEDPNDIQKDGRRAQHILYDGPMQKFLLYYDEESFSINEKSRIKLLWKHQVYRWWIGANPRTLKQAICISIDPDEMMWA